MEIVIGVASFLGGGFLTSVIFIVGYTSRLTAVESSVKNIADKLTLWETKGMPTCALHYDLENRLREIEINEGKN